jgi:hypothetical protein
LLLLPDHREELEAWLQRVIVWICDRYERGPGLASVYADPGAEITYLLGEPYEHVNLRIRTQSYLATVVLDLASALELDNTYDLAFNDFTACQIAFPSVEPLDEPDQYHHTDTGAIMEANIAFDSLPSEGWQRAVHHRRAPESYALDRIGRSWELLAVTLLLRNRHFVATTRTIAVRQPQSAS